MVIKWPFKYYLEPCWFLRTLSDFTEMLDVQKPEFKSLAIRKSCFLFIRAHEVFQKLKSASNNDNLNKKVGCCSELFCDSKLCMPDWKMETIFIFF